MALVTYPTQSGRDALLSAKWITVFLYSVGLFLLGMLATVGFSAATSSIVGNFKGVSNETLGEWVISFGRVLISQLPYVALAFCLALITRSNAVGIAVGIGVGFLEPAIWALLGLVTDAFDRIHEFGLEYHSITLFNMNMSGRSTTTSEAWEGVAVLGVWTAFFVVLTYYFFNKRDVTSG